MLVIKRVLKWLGLLVAAFLIFVILIDIFYPISLQKAKDVSKELLSSDEKWLYVTLNSTQKWRFSPNLQKIDPLYLKMLLNYEDKRFFSHFGVDVLSLIRASYQLVKSGRIVSGASTITMQVAKLLEPRERTFGAKIIDIIRALELEFHYSKKEILKAYLTLAPYGGNIEGVVAASWRYFGKNPSSLSPAEAALLVAMPKNPQMYMPNRHPKMAKIARNRVLKRALENRIIGKRLYLQAINEPVTIRLHRFPRMAAHISHKLLKGQKRVKSTLDYTLQKQIETWAKMRGKQLPKGATFALLVVENSSAKIRAYIGSYDMFNPNFAGFIDMSSKIRSPGSALKPFIYELGFRKHLIHPQTIILDKEVFFGSYHPHNYSKKFHGEVTIAYALQNSLNIPAVKVLYRIGVNEFVDSLKQYIKDFYIPKKVASLPIALGGLGVTLQNMVRGYVALANGGAARDLQIVEKSGFKVGNKQQKSVILTDAILREVVPPPQYKRFFKKIAFKTGTSYGFRDFWSIGFSKDYTIGVWVGRPDGKPVIKASAREIATPIMFEVFNIVEALKGLGKWDYESSIYKTPAPKVLKYFDKNLAQSKKIKFLYPKDGSKYMSAGCHKAVVKIAIDNAKKPIYWYIDGKLIEFNDTKFQLQFTKGAHTITAIDSQANSISSNFWVYGGECNKE